MVTAKKPVITDYLLTKARSIQFDSRRSSDLKTRDAASDFLYFTKKDGKWSLNVGKTSTTPRLSAEYVKSFINTRMTQFDNMKKPYNVEIRKSGSDSYYGDVMIYGRNGKRERIW